MRLFAERWNPLPLLALTILLARAYVTEEGLDIEIKKESVCGEPTKNGDVIYVHYRGTLKDGTQFDASYDRGQPFSFRLGSGEVIKGWDLGLLRMCPGDQRRLIIPPHLAYGDRSRGKIPPNSTLLFDTKLMGINGLDEALADSSKVAAETQAPMASPTNPSPTSQPSSNPPPGSENGECRLLGPFALFIQGGLGILALVSVVWKRQWEQPRRPIKIWAFDVSKQVVGGVLLHILNLAVSLVSSYEMMLSNKLKQTSFDASQQPNPCSFYLINLAIDTTIGVAFLYVILRVLHKVFALTPLARPPESIKSGHYGNPPRTSWWMKQSLIYFIGLVLMKLCVLFIFQILPWIALVGDWALRWTEGSEALQITFVMFIFPLIMNAIQYYLVDNFIKERLDDTTSKGHERIPSQDEDDDIQQRLNKSDDEDEDEDEGEGGDIDKQPGDLTTITTTAPSSSQR